MGKISVILTEETEKRFRDATVKKFGWKKGVLSVAAEEAIKKWLVDS